MEEHPSFREGEPAAWIAAVKILLDDVLDDRPEVAVCLLDAFVSDYLGTS